MNREDQRRLQVLSRLTAAFLGVAFLTGAFAIAAARAEEAVTGKPAAVFPATLHDFGAVDRGEKLEHTFVVRNDGDAPLEILSAKPT